MSDWIKSPAKVKARLAAIRAKLLACRPSTTPRQNIDPERWGIFLMDITGSASSVYMMRYGASIPLSGAPYPHDPTQFPRMKDWQKAAALEVIYKFIKEGKVLGPFPGKTRHCPLTGHPLFFYPSFVVPKSKPGSYRWVLNASYNQGDRALMTVSSIIQRL